ncbi:MAG: hypothetical protein ACXVY6_11290 [Gaiellaceae bacterium]
MAGARVAWILGAAGLGALLLVSAGMSHSSGGDLGAEITIAYGPTCLKTAGGQRCGSIAAVSGIRVSIGSYPDGRQVAAKTSASNGVLRFPRGLPLDFAVHFRGRHGGRLYQGSWRMPNARPFSARPVPLYLLLCPSGGWVASLDALAVSCSDRSPSVLGWSTGGKGT